ncbi:MAG: hypothetical protein M4579_003542 [Chaenotheca gracillima]|nr:MAG: hypothetical protein M4579_003542 [Chaenotheca gracillima]
MDPTIRPTVGNGSHLDLSYLAHYQQQQQDLYHLHHQQRQQPLLQPRYAPLPQSQLPDPPVPKPLPSQLRDSRVQKASPARRQQVPKSAGSTATTSTTNSTTTTTTTSPASRGSPHPMSAMTNRFAVADSVRVSGGSITKKKCPSDRNAERRERERKKRQNKVAERARKDDERRRRVAAIRLEANNIDPKIFADAELDDFMKHDAGAQRRIMSAFHGTLNKQRMAQESVARLQELGLDPATMDPETVNWFKSAPRVLQDRSIAMYQSNVEQYRRICTIDALGTAGFVVDRIPRDLIDQLCKLPLNVQHARMLAELNYCARGGNPDVKPLYPVEPVMPRFDAMASRSPSPTPAPLIPKPAPVKKPSHMQYMDNPLDHITLAPPAVENLQPVTVSPYMMAPPPTTFDDAYAVPPFFDAPADLQAGPAYPYYYGAQSPSFAPGSNTNQHPYPASTHAATEGFAQPQFTAAPSFLGDDFAPGSNTNQNSYSASTHAATESFAPPQFIASPSFLGDDFAPQSYF